MINSSAKNYLRLKYCTYLFFFIAIFNILSASYYFLNPTIPQNYEDFYPKRIELVGYALTSLEIFTFFVFSIKLIIRIK